MLRATRWWSFAIAAGVSCTDAGDAFVAEGEGEVITERQFAERAVCAGVIGAPVETGRLEDEALAEVSGVVPSATSPGVLWMSTDADDEVRLFAVSTTGDSLGSLVLRGATALDVEDLAVAPCPDLLELCIYVADIGDNALERSSFVVYAVVEPSVGTNSPLGDDVPYDDFIALPLVAPTPRADIEALIVLPDASAMVLYEKRNSDARIFRVAAPWPAAEPAALEVTGSFTPPGSTDFDGRRVVTGADIHPSGARLLVRTYLGAFEAALDADHPADQIANADFAELFAGPASEAQGEAIAYDDFGTGVWTVSEVGAETGAHQPLHHAPCE